MKNYLLTISTTVLLTSVVSLILPEGKMGKYIKSFFSVLVLLVIISPVVSLSELDLKNTFSDSKVIQEDYLEYIYTSKTSSLEKDCVNILKNFGVENAKVEIQYDIGENYEYSIKNAIIYLCDAVINSNGEHINNIEESISNISNYLQVERKFIKIYE